MRNLRSILSKRCSFLLFLGLVLAIGLSSCKYEYNEAEKGTKFNSITKTITVRSVDWMEADGYFFFSCDVPELTNEVCKYGTVTCYQDLDAYQIALPKTQHKSVVDAENNIIYYTQTLDFIYGVGFIEIDLTNSDFFYEKSDLENMTFRLQLVW